jgi:hypothetical protein
MFFLAVVDIIHSSLPDPIQADMFMYTIVCTVRRLNRELLGSRRIYNYEYTTLNYKSVYRSGARRKSNQRQSRRYEIQGEDFMQLYFLILHRSLLH